MAQDAETAQFSSESLEWFERQVRPIFAEHCSSCHSESVGNTQGDLSLDSRDAMLAGGESGSVVVPGKPDESLLIEAVRRESLEMPPEKPLSDRERQILVRWVAIGAPWPAEEHQDIATGDAWLEQRFRSHWAWQPVQEADVPQIPDDAWSSNAIDKFILAQLKENNLQPAEECEPHALLRRLSFDLVGLPPQGSAKTDLTEANYSEQVERLLSSPQFGVRWGRHWLDLVRYAETLGHEFDYPLRYAWRYRDAIIDAFNIDLSYDRLLREHLAGDQVSTPRRHPLTGVNQSLAITGFWWLGDSVHAPVDLKNDLATRVDNQIDVFSKTFLGMTVACARCHDHKFDAISTRDYYGMAGVIESSRREYALTDPTGSLARHWSRTRSDIELANQAAESAYSQLTLTDSDVQAWLSAYLSNLGTLDSKQQEGELPATSPLFALRALLDGEAGLGEQAFATSFGRLKSQAIEAEAAFQAWDSESELWADFSQGIPSSWNLSATRHSSEMPSELAEYWPTAEGSYGPSFDWYSATLPIPSRPGIFSSQKLGRKTSVLLTSPDFTLDRNMICIKMRGKSTQSSVIINNYFMNEFHSLLFKDTRKPINQLEDAGWVVHAGDLNKYLGDPAYLSFYDEDNAWFEIEQVRFADRSPPPRPNRVTLDLVGQSIETPAELLAALSSQIAAAFGQYRSDLADGRPLPNSEQEPNFASSEAITIVRALAKASSKNDLALPEALYQLADQARQLQTLDQQAPEPTRLLATGDGTPRNVCVATRGNPYEPGEVVPRGCFESLPGYQPIRETSSGRLELAATLATADHPLTARVVVNRVWHHLMGRGLVKSPDNFGVLGSRPTHPKLLDYLAAEFVRHDWSMKWLIREIVMSRTYRLSSTPTEQNRLLDADGSLWSHRPVRRLTAEALRDAMLATVDSLDSQLAGPSVAVHLNDQMTGRGRPKQSGPLDGDNRRSVYVEVRRNFLDPFLMAFDFPMPSTSAGGRNQSNVPAQALGLLNDPLVLELANRWAEATDHISDSAERAGRMIEKAYGRPATEAEVKRCLEFIEAGAQETSPRGSWSDLAHILINAKEFSYVR